MADLDRNSLHVREIMEISDKTVRKIVTRDFRIDNYGLSDSDF